MEKDEELEIDASGLAATIELDSLAFERWEEDERREAEQDEDEDEQFN